MTSTNIRKLSHSEMDLYRKPLLPETWSCFPVDKDIDTQQLRKALQKDLDSIRSGAEKDPLILYYQDPFVGLFLIVGYLYPVSYTHLTLPTILLV